MNPEKNDRKLIRWLLVATIALLALVLSLQLWQMFGGKTSGGSAPMDSAAPASAQTTEPLDSPAADVSPGKAAMIEDVRTLNAGLSAGDLAKLSIEELEQLWQTGAPGLPIGVSAAAQAAEEYAGTLAVDSVTSETDPELDESPACYEVELRHPTLGDFAYKVDAYTGAVLEGTPDILQTGRDAAAPQEAPAVSQAPVSAAQKPVSDPQKPASEPQKPLPETQAPAAPSGEEAAKDAAFTHAGVSAADASAVRCKLEWKDGRQVYDIEFWVGSTEYDYKIDASTNAVVEAEQEIDGRHGGTSARESGGFIGEEAAKSAALAHAGISAADAGYMECELDEDDGRWIYELAFWVGGAEYDYEVDASSGAVVKAEMDH